MTPIFGFAGTALVASPPSSGRHHQAKTETTKS